MPLRPLIEAQRTNLALVTRNVFLLHSVEIVKLDLSQTVPSKAPGVVEITLTLPRPVNASPINGKMSEHLRSLDHSRIPVRMESIS